MRTKITTEKRASGRNSRGNRGNAKHQKWYKETPLAQMQKATWRRYNSVSGWRCKIPQQNKEYKILSGMKKKTSKFDVIEIKNGHLKVVGNRAGGSLPKEFVRQGGNYLFINGGFFTMDRTVPIPQEYARYYERVVGEDHTFVWAGPPLKRPVNLMEAKFKWTNQNARIRGSLAHANQPNEYLVLVKTSNGNKYIFVYTAENARIGGGKGKGQSVNEMRELIILWFKQSHKTFRVSSITQFVNMDGGGNIYVSWNHGAEETMIA
ncbi:hypothetical protein BU23DRAFT_198505 [Bimuria novae-zelandiae CBS 107.79]|uniref:Uncharacterized protein n=1 Tax=Bimuria novae-zelandiae CBS 107.79 TaxID=1447943 RepID=A0A6A5V433_9PLEO|nr:hypothetical protein BU23DRAFT_198505 [Bimuria novae-zelandiae CBS 107.79]